MAITYTNSSASISTTEYSIVVPGTPAPQTTDGVFQFWLDFSAMTATEQYCIRLYEKYDAAGTQRLVEEWILTGVQSKPMMVIPSMVLGEGWDVTVTKLAGTDRTIYWSIRKIA